MSIQEAYDHVLETERKFKRRVQKDIQKWMGKEASVTLDWSAAGRNFDLGRIDTTVHSVYLTGRNRDKTEVLSLAELSIYDLKRLHQAIFPQTEQ